MRKNNRQSCGKIIIPVGLKPRPTDDEIAVAEILAQHFDSDIEFVDRGISHTPDLYICNKAQYWEIKNIRGNSSKTVENNLRTAQYQSENIIISLSRTKMTLAQAVGRVRQCLTKSNVYAKRILIISKSKTIVVIK